MKFGRPLPMKGVIQMAAITHVESAATDRLTKLGLTVEMIERVVRRADAEASTCTELDPPIVAGLLRWGRMNRYLREELVPLGWGFDNPRNLARTIHPNGLFAIIVATGDELTGLPADLPATKHVRGEATTHAVQANHVQLAFDFGDYLFALDPTQAMLTWILLFHANSDGFRAELSLPTAIVEGRIIGWAERIILPVFPRDEVVLAIEASPADDAVVVAVNRR